MVSEARIWSVTCVVQCHQLASGDHSLCLLPVSVYTVTSIPAIPRPIEALPPRYICLNKIAKEEKASLHGPPAPPSTCHDRDSDCGYLGLVKTFTICVSCPCLESALNIATLKPTAPLDLKQRVTIL